MKSTDERMNEVLGRTRTRQAATRRRRQQMLAVGGGVASIAVIVITSMFAASVGVFDASVLDGPHQLMASVFSNGAALGYVAVGLLGLMLGVAVTVLAYKVGRLVRRLRSGMGLLETVLPIRRKRQRYLSDSR